MKTDDDIMTAEEFFGKSEQENAKPSRTRKVRGKNSAKDILSKVKVKMVMRIYGVSRVKALEIIAKREADMDTVENENANREGSGHGGEELMSAADFFGD